MSPQQIKPCTPEFRPIPGLLCSFLLLSGLLLGGGGYVTGIVPHPNASCVMYCRTNVGGAHRGNANEVMILANPGATLTLVNCSFVIGANSEGRELCPVDKML